MEIRKRNRIKLPVEPIIPLPADGKRKRGRPKGKNPVVYSERHKLSPYHESLVNTERLIIERKFAEELKLIKSRYREQSIPEMAYRFCLLGADNGRLAELFGVTLESIQAWLSTNPAFERAVRAGREYACANVVHSLYKRAIGYDIEEKKYRRKKIVTKDEEGNEIVDYKLVLEEMVIKHFPADISAAKNFLFNRTRNLPKHQRWINESTEVTAKDGEPLFPQDQQTNDEKAALVLANLVMQLGPIQLPEEQVRNTE